jgi:hypothetical protein
MFLETAGILQVVGPFSGNNFEGTRGKPLSITLVGESLGEGDYLLILYSCGRGQGVNGFSTDGRSMPSVYIEESAVAIHRFQDLEQNIGVNPLPGTYRVCWCHRDFTCVDPPEVSSEMKIGSAAFNAQVGYVNMVGPDTDQGRKCVIGAPVSLSVTGTDLKAGDQIAILSACGKSNRVPGIPAGDATVLEGISQESPEGNFYDWGDGLVSAVPGTYMMCWCGNKIRNYPCTSYKHFAADVGFIDVQGPVRAKNVFSCARGLKCVLTIDPATGLDQRVQGVGLWDGDFLLVRSGDCYEDQFEATYGAWTGTKVINTIGIRGRSKPAYDTNTNTTQSYDLGFVSTTVGTFTLCFCSPRVQECADGACASRSCNANSQSSNEDLRLVYRANAGDITITGPYDFQQIVCMRGSTCVVSDLRGTMSNSDRLRVAVGDDASACSSAMEVPRAPNSGISAEATGTGKNYAFQGGDWLPGIGVNTLCWCSYAKSGNCEDPDNFQASAGLLHTFGRFGCARDEFPCEVIVPSSFLEYHGARCDQTSCSADMKNRADLLQMDEPPEVPEVVDRIESFAVLENDKVCAEQNFEDNVLFDLGTDKFNDFLNASANFELSPLLQDDEEGSARSLQASDFVTKVTQVRLRVADATRFANRDVKQYKMCARPYGVPQEAADMLPLQDGIFHVRWYQVSSSLPDGIFRFTLCPEKSVYNAELDKCQCKKSFYMVFNADGNPQECRTCPKGFYCPYDSECSNGYACATGNVDPDLPNPYGEMGQEGSLLPCKENFTTPEGAFERKECECQQGYRQLLGPDADGDGEQDRLEVCVPCPEGRYKTNSGNFTVCNEQCFAAATSLPGSTGIFQCFCDDNYRIFVGADGNPQCVLCAPGEFCRADSTKTASESVIPISASVGISAI